MHLKYRRKKKTDFGKVGIINKFGLDGVHKSDFKELIDGLISHKRFQLGLSSAGLLRPSLSIPAYTGFVPEDGLLPIFNLFDRNGGGKNFTARVSRKNCMDFRGGRLTYDEHDGTDLVCPLGTPLVAAASGTVVLVRNRFLRGGLTVTLDHGGGVLTQYTHCSKNLKEIGSQVHRGEVIALSGASGLDMVHFFPWVPPHIHFMSIVNGSAVDPFLAAGEKRKTGVWYSKIEVGVNMPVSSSVFEDSCDCEDGQQICPPSDFDLDKMQKAAEACTDPTILLEMKNWEHDPVSLSAFLEDALHHDRWAWPEEFHGFKIRPPESLKEGLKLTLPFRAKDYQGVRFTDSKFTQVKE